MIFTSALRNADAAASKSALSSGAGGGVWTGVGRGIATGTGTGARAGLGATGTAVDETVAAVAVNSMLGRVIAGSVRAGTTESVEEAVGAFKTGAGEIDAWSMMIIRRTRKAKATAGPRYSLKRSIGIRYIKNDTLASCGRSLTA